jgi:RNA-directed DNA polymerase
MLLLRKSINTEILCNVKLLHANGGMQHLLKIKNNSVRTKNSSVNKEEDKLGWRANAFLRAMNTHELASSLSCHNNRIDILIAHPEYRPFTIPKKSGGYREIKAPSDELKYTQKRLSWIFNKLYVAPEGVHGFVAKTELDTYSILSNARMHIGKKYVWNLDIESFFSSIPTQLVVNKLMEGPFCFEESKAKYISLLIVYQRQLPMGSPCSPVVSNMVCEKMDAQLNDFVKVQNELNPEANLAYTRYADDITFSSNVAFTTLQKAAVYFCLNQMGFTVNQKKERIQTHLQAQWVTGIKTNEKPNLNRKYIRNIRAALHQAREKGLAQAAQDYFKLEGSASPETIDRFLSVLRGKISHVGFVKGKEDAVYLKYWKEWGDLKNAVKIG